MNRRAAILVAACALAAGAHGVEMEGVPSIDVAAPLGAAAAPAALPSVSLPQAPLSGVEIPQSSLAPAEPAAPAATAGADASAQAAAPSADAAVPAQTPGAGASAVVPAQSSRVNLVQAAGSPVVATRVFEGSRIPTAANSNRGLEPAFEPPTYTPRQPLGRSGDGADGSNGNGGQGSNNGGDEGGNASGRRPQLSFGAPYVTALTAVDPAKAIYGQMRTVYGNDGSRNYWNQFKTGEPIDVVSKGESVFGRPTTVTFAATKAIGKLTREDFAGTVPAYQLKAPIKQLRQALINQLEDSRAVWHANQTPISLATTVRIVKFKSYIELYREAHGPDSTPAIEAPTPRTPLSVKAEGALEPLSMMLPRAVFLDLDLFDGPVPATLISDMAKLQRTGVYFVAFSRKPYADAGSLKDKLIRQLNAYHLSTLLPIRFMAVTDDGAVISMFPKGGNVAPIDVDSFSNAEMDVLRDAAQKSAEAAGVSPRLIKEVKQPAIDESVDEFPGLAGRARAERKDPQVRFQLSLDKKVTPEEAYAWKAELERRVEGQGIEPKMTLEQDASGAWLFSARKTSLGRSLPRLVEALGKEYGLYLNPNDVLVLSRDPQLTSYNKNLDFGALTGLKGQDLVENALGLMLGDHRDNVEGDLSGSASRIASFSRDRARYLSEILIEQNKDEMQINFFSGHVVHAVNDWLVHQLQIGRRPTKAQYAEALLERWDAGLRERKSIPLPKGETMKGWIRESTQRGLSMYEKIVAAADRKEILIGTEIPNFFMLRDYERKTGNVKRRYILHTIFDFIALRPDPNNPGHATLVIYDFKTGPAQSRQKLDHDVQVLTYALFANRRWVGKKFPAPYFSGKTAYTIDQARVEFIYNGIKQPTSQSSWDLDTIRRTIINKLNQIHAAEAKLLGEAPATKKKPATKRGSPQAAAKKGAKRAPARRA